MRKTDEIIEEILRKRGITEKNEREEFLSMKPKITYDPFLFLGMEEGIDLVFDTVKNGGRICIYGDYDADGMTSVCVMLSIFKYISNKVDYYIPSRFTEGFGLNNNAIKKIKDRGTDLIITVDCGSVFHDEIEYAKELGMKVIVTDHHNSDDVRADCITINPKIPENTYPFTGLAGCGVAYKFAQALQIRAGLPKKSIIDLLDIVGIGTVGDIVPLIDENRTIAKYGIYQLNKSKRPGLLHLIENLSLKMGKIGSDEIAYGIVPSLNAAGRMATAEIGVSMMMTEDDSEAKMLADKLTRLNYQRKNVQEKTYDECLKLMEDQCADSLFPVIEDRNAHEGITGIVAGKIKEKINRPVAIVTPTDDGHLKGTGRSINSIDIFSVMSNSAELLSRFGGHKMACGFLLDKKNLNNLRSSLNEKVGELFSDDPSLFDFNADFDMELMAAEVNMDLAKRIESVAPFGNSNERPLFIFKNATISDINLMGNNGIHVRFKIAQDCGKTLQCVLFRRADVYMDKLMSNKRCDIIGSLNLK